MRTTLLTTLLLAGLVSAANISPTPPTQKRKSAVNAFKAGMKTLKTTCPKTAVKPAKARKILVLNLCGGHPHTSIPLTAQAIEAMGKATGAYEADFTNDMTAFADDILKDYDAVVLNNTTKLPITTPQKKALMDFVKSGKGLVSIHGASDNFYDWPEGAALVGCLFDKHPWTKKTDCKFKIEGNTPLTAMFKQGFRYTEEIYQLKTPYSRENLRVVLTLDMSDAKTAAPKEQKRADKDNAVSFCQKVGKGRSFYTSFGHNEAVVVDAAVLKHFLAAIQYAAGDLKVDDSPSGKLVAAPTAPAAPVEVGTGPYAALLNYTYAQGQTKTVTMLQDIANKTPIEQYPALEARLLATYSSPKATVDCKTVCLETLRPIATCKTTRVIAPALLDEKLSDDVRAVLEGITCPLANPALRNALAKTDNDMIRCGLISTLAARGDVESASAIGASLKSENATLRVVAIKALGRIGTQECANILTKLSSKKYDDEAVQVSLAYVKCLKTNPTQLLAFYKSAPIGPRVKAVALGILARADASLAIGPLLDALDSKDKTLAKTANSTLSYVQSEAFTKAIAGAVASASPAKQAKLVSILSSRGGPSAAAGIRAAATSKDPVLQQAVATALGQMGTAADLPAVLSLTQSDNADVATAAKAALGTMPGADVSPTLAKLLASGKDKRLMIEAVHARKAPEALGSLLTIAGDMSDKNAFVAAIKALSDYGTVAQIAPLVKLYVATPSSGYTKAIASIANRTPDVEARSTAVAAALPAATGKAKAGLLALAPKLGGKSVLKIVQSLLNDKDLGETATRALCEWSTPEPMDDLLAMCKATNDNTLKILTLRGYVTQLAMRADLGPDGISAKAIEAYPLATRADEKRMVLSLLEKFPAMNGLEFVKTLKDNDVAKDIRSTESRLTNALTKITMTASHSGSKYPPKNALDNNPKTRWGTGTYRRPGQWVIIDLKTPRHLSGLTLKYGKSPNDGPSGYEVLASDDGKTWTSVVKSKAKAQPKLTRVKFGKSIKTRYIKIVQNGRSKKYWWAIHQVEFWFPK